MERRSSACPLDCPDVCGLTVTVDDGRVVRVDGDRRGPITDGVVCGKVRNFADHMYGTDRVRTPLVRDGAKGAGSWRPVSWDDALSLVTERVKAIRSRSGAEAILPYHYGGSNGWLTEGGLASRFFRRLGSSNLDRTFCAAATTAAMRGMYGSVPGIALEDLEHAALIVLWAVNPSATSIHSVPVIRRARERGAKLVVIDPRRTPLAKAADLHLAVRPGTDLPVALAVAHALFTRGYADRSFLAARTTGAETLSARAAAWTLDAAAAEAGVSAADLDAFVELYATSSPAAIRVGWGLERNRNGGSAVAAVLALPAIAGKFGPRGGGYVLSNNDAKWGITAEGGIAADPPPTRTVNMSRIADALVNERDPRIECLFVYNCNPVATAPDQRALVEQLAREDLFVVVHDAVMTDTAALADVVLPATTFLEHRELRRGYGVMRMFDSPPVAARVGEARSNTELFAELLRRFELCRTDEQLDDAAVLEQIFAASPEGASLRAQLDERGIATPPVGTHPRLFVDVQPDTPDAKIHLVPSHLDVEAAATGGLYAYQPDPRSDAYPLALISPSLTTQISSTFGQLRDRPAELVIHPADAARRGLASGDPIRVWNVHGEVHCLATVSADTREGVCVLPKGLWRKHAANGYTANALIPFATADLGGQAAWNDARVQVARLSHQALPG